MNQGLCPKCDHVITSVQMDDVTINVNLVPQWKGSSYYCPHCKAVLGVVINPLLVRQETVAQVADALKAVRDEIVNGVVNALKNLWRRR